MVGRWNATATTSCASWWSRGTRGQNYKCTGFNSKAKKIPSWYSQDRTIWMVQSAWTTGHQVMSCGPNIHSSSNCCWWHFMCQACARSRSSSREQDRQEPCPHGTCSLETVHTLKNNNVSNKMYYSCDTDFKGQVQTARKAETEPILRRSFEKVRFELTPEGWGWWGRGEKSMSIREDGLAVGIILQEGQREPRRDKRGYKGSWVARSRATGLLKTLSFIWRLFVQE